MRFEEYTPLAVKTALPTALNFEYLSTGIIGEVGELTSIFAKTIRDDGSELSEERRLDTLDELGDVLWYLAVLTYLFGDPSALPPLDSSYRPVASEGDDVIAALLTLSMEVNQLVDGLLKASESKEGRREGLNLEIVNAIVDDIAFIASFLDSDINYVAARNTSKLKSRQDRGKIGGSGDHR